MAEQVDSTQEFTNRRRISILAITQPLWQPAEPTVRRFKLLAFLSEARDWSRRRPRRRSRFATESGKSMTDPMPKRKNFSPAAIQSVHANRAISGYIDWPEIVLLYEGLVQIAPGIGSLVGRAVALAQAGKLAAGFSVLEEIPAGRIVSYQPYWAARGHLLQLLDRKDEALKAFTRAASLTDDPALREYLFKRSAGNI